ncbi:MAG TPA: hypothetical protein VLZ07_03825 [Syntrophales bacterium]|nr:hypothetical protein [Syntrophales bacterium]
MLSLIRFAILCFFIYLLYKLAKWIILSAGIKGPDETQHRVPVAKGEDLVEDPYCHTYVPVSQAFRASIDGHDVFFCSKECFEKYISEKSTKKAQGAA